MEVQKLYVTLALEAAKYRQGLDDARKTATSFGNNMKSIMANVAKAMIPVGLAAAAVGVALKKAFDTLKQGAALTAARAKFENLAKSISTTADALLGKMKEATKGMISDANLIASGTEIISLGLAKTEEDVTRLATVVSALGWDMQQVILTFANDSTMRLDALGLSVADVTERQKELAATGMTMAEAFDAAVLEAGEAKMKLFGDQSQTTAGKIQKLITVVENAGNTFQESFAEGMAEGVGAAIDNVELLDEAIAATAKNAGDLFGQLGGTAAFQFANRGMRDQLKDLGADLGEIDKQVREIQKAEGIGVVSLGFTPGDVVAAAGEYELLANELERIKNLAITVHGREDWRDFAGYAGKALSEATQAAQEHSYTIEEIARQQARVEKAQEKAARDTRNRAQWLERAADMVRDAQERAAVADYARAQSLEAQAKAAEAAALALQTYNTALGSVIGDYDKPLRGSDLPLITPARNVSVTTGGLTADQSALAEEYTKRIERLNEEVRDLTFGIGTYGMEQEKVNEKIADAQGEIAHYQALLNPLNEIVGETSTVHQGLTVNVNAARQAIYDQMLTIPGAETAAVLFGVAIGVLTEAQAEAALKAAALKVKIDELAGRLASGKLGVDEALAELDTFIVWLEEDAPAGVQSFIDMVPTMLYGAGNTFKAGAEALGKAISQGIADGINSGAGAVNGAINSVGGGAIGSMENQLIIDSPSQVFAEMGEMIIDGLIDGLDEKEETLYQKMADIADTLIGIGMGVGDLQMFPVEQAMGVTEDAISANADAFEVAAKQLAPFASEGQIDALLKASPERAAEILRLIRNDRIYSLNPEAMRRLQAAIELADARNLLEDEYIAQQDELLKLQEKQAALEEQRRQLDFLQYQIDLLNLIKDNNLDASILEGLALGVNANMSDIIAAMTAAVSELVAKTEEELGIASPSSVFEGIGANMMLGLMTGINKTAAELDGAFDKAMSNITGGGSGTIDNSKRAVNYGGQHFHIYGRMNEESPIETIWRGAL